MKAYELLYINKSVLEAMISASIDVSDLKYLDLYKEYIRLKGEGHKKTYINAVSFGRIWSYRIEQFIV